MRLQISLGRNESRFVEPIPRQCVLWQGETIVAQKANEFVFWSDRCRTTMWPYFMLPITVGGDIRTKSLGSKCALEMMVKNHFGSDRLNASPHSPGSNASTFALPIPRHFDLARRSQG